MLLHRKNGQRLDLTNKVRGRRSLEALGFTCSNADPGWYYDGSVYRQAASNECRYSAEGGRTGLLSESSDENLLLYSSENDAAWTVSNATKSAEGTSIINGKTPLKVTASAAGGYINQTVGTTATDCYFIIVEQGNSTVADIEVYDGGGGTVSRIRLTFATGAVSQISGVSDFSGAYRITSSGPNGGATWILYVTASGLGGARSVRFYPDAITGTKYSYLHHSQLSTQQAHPTSPIVTQGSSGTRGNDVISSTTIPTWWNNDEITVLATIERMFYITEVGAIFLATNNATTDYVLLTADASGTNEGKATVNVNTVTYDSLSATAATYGSKQKYGLSAKDGSTYGASAGGAGPNGAQVGAPAAPERLDIGQGFGAAYWLEGRIYEIIIRPKAMSNTELENYTS